jgi:hypothetical protein
VKTIVLPITACLFLATLTAAETHPPMRPLPQPIKGDLAPGPKRFVDAAKGDDANDGSQAKPWKTLGHSFRQLKPGDTLYLRGGTYYEKAALSRSGTPEAPITISSHPGELAVIDGGLREFLENPAGSWEPLTGGAAGEYISTRTFPDADTRRAPTQFLPGSWEPLWGIEDERPLALGNFADSMVPLHGYRFLNDLRSKNEHWLTDKKDPNASLYGGPGLWYNRDTARIHIRLAHQHLPGLADRAYKGETDPRKVPLIIALGFGDDVFRVTGIKNVNVRGIVFRGATGSPMINLYGSQEVTFDRVTIYGGFPCLAIDASQGIRVTQSAFRGLVAPWTSRAHMKYRGTATYQIVLKNSQPVNENIEFANCEFTDDHDFAYFRHVKNLQFHHNFVDNFNDDGLETGPKLRSHTMFVFQNRIGASLSTFTQHEVEKDESPVDHDPESGVYIYRNVIDARPGTYKFPSKDPDPSGSYLNQEGHLAGDHGSPVWSVMKVYHNTMVRQTPVFRDYFLFGLGVQGLRNNERDVFNNVFVQFEGVPGVGFAGIKEPGKVREGGNILWGPDGGKVADPFAKFRGSPLFALSKTHYEPGLTTHDRVANPQFVSLPDDLRLKTGSPAVDSGQPVPAEWPDPLRELDKGGPDSGALPLGAKPWGVGIDGRIPLFGK